MLNSDYAPPGDAAPSPRSERTPRWGHRGSREGVSGCRGAIFGWAAVAICGVLPLAASPLPTDSLASFTEKYCVKCHNDVDQDGRLDLTNLAFSPGDPANFQRWVDVHDRLQAGEMPP